MGVDFQIHGLEFQKKSTPWPNKAKKAFYLVQKTLLFEETFKTNHIFFPQETSCFAQNILTHVE